MSGVFNGESTSLHHSNLSLQTICGAKLSWLRERSQIPVCFRLMTAMWLSAVDYKIPNTNYDYGSCENVGFDYIIQPNTDTVTDIYVGITI